MTIVQQLFEILIRKRQPHDLDYDISAAVMSFVAIVGLGYVITSMQSVYTKPLAYSVTQSLTQAIVIYLLLKVAKKENRFVQTITAIFGVSVMLQMTSLIFLQVPILAATTLFLTLWNFYLSILILKAALECSILQSVMLTIGYQFIVLFVLTIFYPELIEEFMSLADQMKKTA